MGVQKEIRSSQLFRFDWWFKSRTPLELHRRVDSLLKLIQKEIRTMKKSPGKASPKVGQLSSKLKSEPNAKAKAKVKAKPKDKGVTATKTKVKPKSKTKG